MESERLRLEVEALMANPEQQGLKQNPLRRTRDARKALMANPEQQGLKHERAMAHHRALQDGLNG